MVQLYTGNALAVREERGSSELLELATIQEGLQNILLDIQVMIVDRLEPLA
jgi:hypothetical protein